jgi:ribose transport system substrate-binding protein
MGRNEDSMTRDNAKDTLPTSASAAVVTGLGPLGEAAASADQLRLSDEKAALARAAHYRVAVVLHKRQSDWGTQQMAGISETLARFGAAVSEVVYCAYRAEDQISGLSRVIESRPDAIISIPVSNVKTAEAHLEVARAGIKLVLINNVPFGMDAGKDYVSVVSSDNFGNGEAAAAILAEHVGREATVGIVSYAEDFFVTNERELGFRKWVSEHRPDIKLRRTRFAEVESAGDVTMEFLDANPVIDALFVVWDEPAMQGIKALRAAGRQIPVVSIDLGREIAVEIARGDLVKGVGAQRPYDQGVAEALVAMIALTGGEPPPWIALPALSVTSSNILHAFEIVWHGPAPAAVRRALEQAR